MPLRPTREGPRVQAVGKYRATIPKVKPGEHMWIIAGVWRVRNPSAQDFELDMENLLTLDGPGCFVCEQDYTPEMAVRRCPGEPRQ